MAVVVPYVAQAAVTLAASYVVGMAFSSSQSFKREGSRLDDTNIVGSRYGAGIPIIFGRARVGGNVIWARPLREEVTEEKQTSRGKFGGKTTVTNTSYAYYATFAVLLTGNEIAGPLRIWCDKKLLWESPDGGLYHSGELSGGGTWEFMTGHAAQSANALMVEDLGIENTPAYRDRSVLVVAELPVDQFGQRIPSIEVEVAESSGVVGAHVADMLIWICEKAGIDSSQIDVTDVGADAWGARIEPGTTAEIVNNILFGTNLQAVYNGLAVAFKPIEQPVAAEIHEGDLLAGERRFPIKRLREDDLPRAITVEHIDPERIYQVGSQRAMRHTSRSAQVLTVTSPLVISANDAARIANSLLYRAWIARIRYESFGLPPKYLFLEPGDVIRVDIDGRSHMIRLHSITIGANGVLQCEGESYDASVLSGIGEGDSGYITEPTVPTYGETILRIMNAPPLNESEATTPGFTFAGTGTGASWKSGILDVSPDSGASWSQLSIVPSYVPIGIVEGSLADPPVHIGACNYDMQTELIVEMVRGGLSSASDVQLRAGANRAMVGNEVIQFGHAELIDTRKYKLTKLLRGRRGTEHHMRGHDTEEPFTMLANSVFVPLQTTEIGQTRLYRLTAAGSAESTVQDTFTPDWSKIRPWSPTMVRGHTDESGTTTITWQRRSRIGSELPNSGDIPLDEPSELYVVEVLDPGTGAVVRSTEVGAAKTWSYEPADQNWDFGFTFSGGRFRVSQKSINFGILGYPTEINF